MILLLFKIYDYKLLGQKKKAQNFFKQNLLGKCCDKKLLVVRQNSFSYNYSFVSSFKKTSQEGQKTWKYVTFQVKRLQHPHLSCCEAWPAQSHANFLTLCTVLCIYFTLFEYEGPYALYYQVYYNISPPVAIGQSYFRRVYFMYFNLHHLYFFLFYFSNARWRRQSMLCNLHA